MSTWQVLQGITCLKTGADIGFIDAGGQKFAQIVGNGLVNTLGAYHFD